MTTNEVAAIVICLVVGYWMVSKLISIDKGPSADKSQRSTGEPEASEPEHEPEPEPEPTPQPRSKPDLWHHVLKVQPHATVEEIQRAYRVLMSQYHPDKVASLGEELKILAERKSKDITTAYREAMRVRRARV